LGHSGFGQKGRNTCQTRASDGRLYKFASRKHSNTPLRSALEVQTAWAIAQAQMHKTKKSTLVNFLQN
jgi:hypothetical protein